MSSVIVKEGVGYGNAGMYLFQGETTHPLYKTPTGNEPQGQVAKPIDALNSNPWSPWGTQNNLPDQFAQYFDGCSTLTSGVDTRCRLAIGKGITPYLVVDKDPATGEENLKYCADSEITDFLEEADDYSYAYGITNDSLKYAWDCTKLLYNRGRTKITRLERADVATMRLEKANPATGIIENVYQSWDWAAGHSYDAKYHTKTPLLQPGREWYDLQQRTEGFEFAIINRTISNNRYYYPLPLWWAAKIWVDIAMEIPLYKKAGYKNQMSIKYVISISQKYWDNNVPNYNKMTPEEKKAARDKKLDEIDKYLVGSPNAHKSIFATTYIDPATQKEIKDIQIEVVDDKLKDGKMLPDSSNAEKHILFALQVNPALNGSNLLSDGASGGAGSGSDIREATLVQIMVNEFERRKAARVFNIIKKVNGWQARYPQQLVFRYPASILTTLDTGKSTKEEKT